MQQMSKLLPFCSQYRLSSLKRIGMYQLFPSFCIFLSSAPKCDEWNLQISGELPTTLNVSRMSCLIAISVWITRPLSRVSFSSLFASALSMYIEVPVPIPKCSLKSLLTRLAA